MHRGAARHRQRCPRRAGAIRRDAPRHAAPPGDGVGGDPGRPVGPLAVEPEECCRRVPQDGGSIALVESLDLADQTYRVGLTHVVGVVAPEDDPTGAKAVDQIAELVGSEHDGVEPEALQVLTRGFGSPSLTSALA